MNQENPEEILLAVVNKVLEFSNQGKQAKAQHILPFVYESVMQYPTLLWDNPELWKLAKSLLVMHHYDLVEGEDEEIKMLQMALVMTQRAIELCESDKEHNKEHYFNALHTQVLLLSTCPDYYEETIAELCSKTVMSEEERVIALRMASRILPRISYNVIVKVDDNFKDFNGDELLSEMCAQFEQENPDIQPKQLDDAQKIHAMLVRSYLKFFK
ncbi:MAG: hypothetical protein MJ197_09585 [Bacteroidales bacterium]|nr:hypothetical protein [Bacteroidales bacterium]